MTSVRYFIDTNIFIYAVGRHHPFKGPCVRVIERIRDGKVIAVVNTEVIQEILYHYQAVKELAYGIRLAREIRSVAVQVLPVTDEDIVLAMEILEASPQIRARDSFHVATMIHSGIDEIASVDRHFDLIQDIKRIPPEHID